MILLIAGRAQQFADFLHGLSDIGAGYARLAWPAGSGVYHQFDRISNLPLRYLSGLTSRLRECVLTCPKKAGVLEKPVPNPGQFGFFGKGTTIRTKKGLFSGLLQLWVKARRRNGYVLPTGGSNCCVSNNQEAIQIRSSA